MDKNYKNNGTALEREKQYIEEAKALTMANAVLTTRLSLAGAFQSMWIKAFNALLHHSINVRDLPEFNDRADLDRALEVGVEHGGASRIMDYIKRVENGIKAAVRRKGFKEV